MEQGFSWLDGFDDAFGLWRIKERRTTEYAQMEHVGRQSAARDGASRSFGVFARAYPRKLHVGDRARCRLYRAGFGVDERRDGKITLAPPYDKPYDFAKKNDPRTFLDLLTDEGLSFVAGYASGVSPWKRYIVSTSGVDANQDGNADDVNGDGAVNDADRTSVSATDFIERAHAKGLLVHTWTFRSEAVFLASDYAASPTAEYDVFYKLGIDGVFSDFPDAAIKARNAMTP